MALHRAIHALPPPRSRGAPVVPRAGSNPPPLHGTAALGSPRPAPEGLSGFALEPARPFHAPPLTSRSPWARPVSPAPVHNHQGPGPRSPGTQPRPPPRYPSGGARPGPVRPRGDGVALPPPPPGFAPVDDARRDSSPPSGVRAPPMTAAPDSASALGSPADFGQPRPLLCPGQPPGDALRLSSPYPLPLTRAPAHQPTPPPPPHVLDVPPPPLPTAPPHRWTTPPW